eukprot:612349-Pleurochrysis_carterae.AAC.1
MIRELHKPPEGGDRYEGGVARGMIGSHRDEEGGGEYRRGSGIGKTGGEERNREICTRYKKWSDRYPPLGRGSPIPGLARAPL